MPRANHLRGENNAEIQVVAGGDDTCRQRKEMSGKG